eukprot:Nk52_evm69s352 gene=Nk52_evmTU69s352
MGDENSIIAAAVQDDAVASEALLLSEYVNTPDSRDVSQTRERNLTALPPGEDLFKPPHFSDFPKAIPYILGNEFCERFTAYGIRAVIVVYLVQQLQFTNANATAVFHTFVMLQYFTPLLGAIMSDGGLGKYKTILYMSSVYCIGCIILSLAAVMSPTDAYALSVTGTFSGLLLIAVGTGGIKPCVAAFGAEQFGTVRKGKTISSNSIEERVTEADQEEISSVIRMNRQAVILSSFFAVFYFSINAGALLSTIFTPMLEHDVHCFGSDTCYSLAFGVPALLMLVALILFFAGRKLYIITKPSESDNVIVQVFCIISFALNIKFSGVFRRAKTAFAFLLSFKRPKRKTSYILTDSSEQPESSDTMANNLAVTEHYDTTDLAWSNVESESTHWLDCAKAKYGRQGVEDVKRLLKVLVLFIPLPAFWMAFDQQGSRWTLQAMKLNGNNVLGFLLTPDGNNLSVFGLNSHIPCKWLGHVSIQPEQMQACNSIFVVSLIPVFEKFVYPFLTRRGLLTRPLQRIGAGLFLSGMAFMVSAFLQWRVEACIADLNSQSSETVTICTNLSMLWQIPQYFVMTVAEILLSITCIDFAYSQAPVTMKSVCQAANLLTTSFGNLLVVIITECGLMEAIFQEPSGNDGKVNHLLTMELVLYAGIVFTVNVIFVVLSVRYEYVSGSCTSGGEQSETKLE